MPSLRKILLGLLLLAVVSHAEEIYATFTVKAQKSASLAFNASGVVEKVNVDVGSIVKKGEPLANLKSNDIRANMDVTQTALKYAKRDYNRQLKVKNIIDQSRLDGYAFKYENAKAQLMYQQALLDKTILDAPFDGVITFKEVEVGDTVSGLMLKTVLKIESEHARKLLIEFDQKYWRVVKEGLVFKYQVDGDETLYEGRITKVYPSADAQSRKITAEVKAEDIPVGLFGTGSIMLETK